MMKFNKGFFCLVLTLSAQGLQAQDFEGMKLTSDGRFPMDEELCGLVIGDAFAKLTMLKRQNGSPMSEVMADASDADKTFGLSGTMREMVIDAYERPRFSTKEHRERAVTDFANEWMLSCYKAQR
jgi:hypothetical protein